MPVDLEDVVGAAVADFLRRLFALWSCLALGALLLVLAAVGSTFLFGLWQLLQGGGWTLVDGPDPVGVLVLVVAGFFPPLFTEFGLLHGVFLIALALYIFRADSPSPYVWGGGVAVAGLSLLGTFHDGFILSELILTAGLFLVEVVGVFFFLKWWQVRARVHAEAHLRAIAEENARKREENRKRNGGAVADRDFATGGDEDR